MGAFWFSFLRDRCLGQSVLVVYRSFRRSLRGIISQRGDLSGPAEYFG